MIRHTGFTLVELLITLVVAGILLAIGIPSFQQGLDNRRLTGAADNLLADMRFARAEAMKTNTAVVVTFTTGDNWSYTMNTTPSKTSNGSDYKGSSLSVSAAVTAASSQITFDPKRNTLTPTPAATELMVTITSALGEAVALQVTPESTIRLCTSTGVSGYPACS